MMNESWLDPAIDPDADNVLISEDELAHLRKVISTLRDEIKVWDITAESYRKERDQARSARDEVDNQLTVERLRHETDIKAISDALLEAAEEQSFCSEFDDWLDSLNRNLSSKSQLEPRKKEYDVEFFFRKVIRVTAVDAEEAEELARHDPEYHEVTRWDEQSDEAEVREVED